MFFNSPSLISEDSLKFYEHFFYQSHRFKVYKAKKGRNVVLCRKEMAPGTRLARRDFRLIDSVYAACVKQQSEDICAFDD